MVRPFAFELGALRRPAAAFAGDPPPLGRALGALLVRWIPPALVSALLSARGTLGVYEGLRAGRTPALAAAVGLDAEGLRQLLAALPPAPPFGQVWPWVALALPFGLLGVWLHDAAWDHAALWMLGGLRAGRGFRATLVAEAQALRAAVLGSAAGLLGFLPGLGGFLALPLLVLDGYLWILRGVALAARHGCEPWRGVAATVLHAGLVAAFFAAAVLAAILILRTGP